MGDGLTDEQETHPAPIERAPRGNSGPFHQRGRGKQATRACPIIIHMPRLSRVCRDGYPCSGDLRPTVKLLVWSIFLPAARQAGRSRCTHTVHPPPHLALAETLAKRAGRLLIGRHRHQHQDCPGQITSFPMTGVGGGAHHLLGWNAASLPRDDEAGLLGGCGWMDLMDGDG